MIDLTSTANSMFGKMTNDCVLYQARSIYLIEPRVLNEDIRYALEYAWQQPISREIFVDSSYLTHSK